MGRRLKGTVILRGPKGRAVFVGGSPEADVPDWAREKLNARVWESDGAEEPEPVPAQPEVEAEPVEVATTEEAATTDDVAATGDEPSLAPKARGRKPKAQTEGE